MRFSAASLALLFEFISIKGIGASNPALQPSFSNTASNGGSGEGEGGRTDAYAANANANNNQGQGEWDWDEKVRG